MKRKIRFRLILISLVALLWWLVERQKQEHKSEISVSQTFIPVKTTHVEKPVTSPAAPAKRAAPHRKQPADDLKLVRGIGPKIEKVLKEAGITTFTKLAETDVSELETLLKSARLPMTQPEAWREQARKLAESQ